MSTLRWRKPSRRAVLRGAGVALTLPWLESLLPAEARAQAGVPIRRFLPIFLPNGASENWAPSAAGAAAAWQLSPVLDELAPVKSRVTVMSGFENGSVFNPDGSASVEPPHSRQPGAWLTCADADEVKMRLGVADANGVSVDQLLAQHPVFGNRTPLESLQLGLTTVPSNCDGKACSLSRSVSWRTETQPLYKLVDPAEAFERLVGITAPPRDDLAARKRLAERKSVLDAVLDSATQLKPKLSAHDNQRLDEFFTSVREVEQRLEARAGSGTSSCPVLSSPVPPGFPSLRDGELYLQNTGSYDRRQHAELMNDLIVLAFQCDVTRVISYMLDDEYADFFYNFLPVRSFTATGSVETDRFCGTYSSAQHGPQDDYATLTRWHVGLVASLCAKLDTVLEEDGRSVLDNSVVFLGSCMHGSNHACNELPALFVGSGGGRLKTDLHVKFGNRPLRDFYFTLMNGVFDMNVADFGVNRTGAPIAMLPDLLA